MREPNKTSSLHSPGHPQHSLTTNTMCPNTPHGHAGMFAKTNNATALRVLEGLKPLHAPPITTGRISTAYQLHQYLQQSFPDADTRAVGGAGALLAMAGKQLRTSMGIGSTSKPLWLEVQAYPGDQLEETAPSHLPLASSPDMAQHLTLAQLRRIFSKHNSSELIPAARSDAREDSPFRTYLDKQKHTYMVRTGNWT